MINEFLAKLPSTNFRIFVTMNMVILTTLRYLASDTHAAGFRFEKWEPSEVWLLFLAAMAGLDLAQFHLKRKSHLESPPAKPDVEDEPALAEGTQEVAGKTRTPPAEPAVTVTTLLPDD